MPDQPPPQPPSKPPPQPPAASPGPPAPPAQPGPLAHIPLFAALSVPDQATLVDAMRTERAEENKTVCWMGERGDSLYLVSSGRVVVTVPNERGEHVVLHTIGAGGFFGEISLLDGGPRTASVRAVEPTRLYCLSRESFHGFLLAHPAAAVEILAVMGARQRASTGALRGMKNVNTAFESRPGAGWDRLSDLFSLTAVRPWFLVANLALFGGWFAVNLLAADGRLPPAWSFDPFPFGLLSVVVGIECIILAIFIMVAQARQADKDRLRNDLDYQVNVRAHAEVMDLARRLDRVDVKLDQLKGGG